MFALVSANKQPALHARALVVIGLILMSAAHAATNPPTVLPRFVVRSWQIDAGLPQNTVNAIVQTRDGYLWLGTQAGLARFDGVRFTVFGLAEGLPSTQVLALHEDKAGQLWIGTTGGGLCRWREGRLESVPPAPGFADVNITSFAEDQERRLWIGTSAGLLLRKDDRFISHQAVTALDGSLVRELLGRRSGVVWIGSSLGLFEINGDRFTELSGPPGEEKITSSYAMLEDRNGHVWISIGNGKVLCHRQGTWRTYNESDGLPFAYISSLAETGDATIWAGSLDDGLYYLSDDRFHAVRTKDGLPSNAIRSLLADREEHLWVGTRSAGLSRLAQAKLLVYGPGQGLTNEYVRSVAEAADGQLWVATTGGGMYRGGPDRFEAVPSIIGNVTFPFMESVIAVRDGSLWWGGAGVLVQWKNGRMETNYTRANADWLADAGVSALREDARDGLWIGTTRGNLLLLRNGQLTPLTNRVARGSVTALEQEPDGTIWVGSVAGGLVRVRPDGVTTFGTTNGLLSNEIRTLYRNEAGTLWIGTGGGGLSRLKDGRLNTFTARQGLGDDTVSQILEDNAGNLWLGCNRGIFRIYEEEFDALVAGTISSLHSRAFGTGEGMPVEECSGGFYPAGLRTKSGQLCFSTVNGVVLLNPDQPESNLRSPQVLIEEVLVEGQRQALVRETNAARVTDRPAGSLTLPPGRRDIEFHYTGLSFAAPAKVQFRYRLENYDPEWIEAGTRRVAYYPRIPPGHYTFQVVACNADNVWTQTPVALAVTVRPYFWETRWFPVVGGVLVLGALAGTINWVVRRRYQRWLARLETRHAIERERLRISQDMHDDIGSILTRVSILSDVGQSETDATQSARQFERIGTQVRAAVVALDEIVWATNPGDDNLPRFAEYVGRFADECFENTPVRCWQEMPTDLPKLPLRADIRHNVFLAIKEALNNVLKHSGASEVWLRLKFADATVSVEVEDNGRGFQPGPPSPEGNGLRNLKSRLEECGGHARVTSAPGQGTRIRFVFPVPKKD